jgi:hypothetical protein
MPGPVVRIEGMSSLRRELRRVSTEFPREIRTENLAVAQDVATRARSEASSLGGVHRHVQSGIKAGATMSAGRITLDGIRQPAIFGAEFGGGRRPSTRQFPPWRGSGRNAGYMVYPTIWDRSHDIASQYEKLIDDLLKRGRLRA